MLPTDFCSLGVRLPAAFIVPGTLLTSAAIFGAVAGSTGVAAAALVLAGAFDVPAFAVAAVSVVPLWFAVWAGERHDGPLWPNLPLACSRTLKIQAQPHSLALSPLLLLVLLLLSLLLLVLLLVATGCGGKLVLWTLLSTLMVILMLLPLTVFVTVLPVPAV